MRPQGSCFVSVCTICVLKSFTMARTNFCSIYFVLASVSVCVVMKATTDFQIALRIIFPLFYFALNLHDDCLSNWVILHYFKIVLRHTREFTFSKHSGYSY